MGDDHDQDDHDVMIITVQVGGPDVKLYPNVGTTLIVFLISLALSIKPSKRCNDILSLFFGHKNQYYNLI